MSLTWAPARGGWVERLSFEGKPDDILESEASLTGKYLAGKEFIPVPRQRRTPGKKKLVIRGAQGK